MFMVTLCDHNNIIIIREFNMQYETTSKHNHFYGMPKTISIVIGN